MLSLQTRANQLTTGTKRAKASLDVKTKVEEPSYTDDDALKGRHSDSSPRMQGAGHFQLSFSSGHRSGRLQIPVTGH